MTPNDVMAGVLTNRGIPDKVHVSYPRKGGQKIKLKPVDKKAQWALILKQKGVK